jgi:hypothetical protein
MLREVYRVKDREDRELRLWPSVSGFLRSTFYSTLWESWKTIIKINAELVASQGRLETSRISLL